MPSTWVKGGVRLVPLFPTARGRGQETAQVRAGGFHEPRRGRTTAPSTVHFGPLWFLTVPVWGDKVRKVSGERMAVIRSNVWGLVLQEELRDWFLESWRTAREGKLGPQMCTLMSWNPVIAGIGIAGLQSLSLRDRLMHPPLVLAPFTGSLAL